MPIRTQLTYRGHPECKGLEVRARAIRRCRTRSTPVACVRSDRAGYVAGGPWAGCVSTVVPKTDRTLTTQIAFIARLPVSLPARNAQERLVIAPGSGRAPTLYEMQRPHHLVCLAVQESSPNSSKPPPRPQPA